MKDVIDAPAHTASKQPNASEKVLHLQTLAVYHGRGFRVVDGANLGDPFSVAEDLELADVYALSSHAERTRLSIEMNGSRLFVGQGSDLGTCGAELHLDCAAVFMTPDGSTVEILVLAETDENGSLINCFLLPLAPLDPAKTYALISLNRETARTRLAEVACVSFTRGTHITMSNGRQVSIEDLKVGDMVLTRDNGPQEIRWIGQQTMRATGAFAPIVIKAGALNNSGDLTVSPNHRVFIYQRRDAVNAGRAEVLVKARLLVNGVNVIQSQGGFVDYFQLLFDSHEIIYAEGIAAESMFVDGQVKPYLPEDVQAHVSEHVSAGTGARAIELSDGTLDASIAADILRAASSG